MTQSSEIDDLAAEFVLGTLEAAERAAVMARRTREPDLDAAIAQWEARLAPLNDVNAPIAPPADMKARVLERITRIASSPPDASIVDLKRRLAQSRRVAVGATALAASLAGALIARETLRPIAPNSYVAVLQKDAQSPAFLMTVDLDSRTFTVRAVAAEVRPGKSYELWLVNDKLGAPRSLGVVGDQAFTASPKLAAFASGDIADATYAVTVEPVGGSSSGLPTGPVVYAGKLVQTKP